ncbi:cytochrome C oxidase subunit IV family protein [Amniculibacterium aquaticum]|uniref:cytochrome C oxidase subunit IV family protein n=1 Tax=Amniculibacterium aquaticum TaxID=2479858 RepID=UPI000F5947B3|nr:cytochrome C oxidase subunit IV family protein [Amniculibacterium aquaticum]
MHKKLLITYIVLILLTLTGAFLAGLTLTLTKAVVVVGIVLVSVVKFLTVAMEFMELKEAHNFWKVLLFFYVGLISTVFIILL